MTVIDANFVIAAHDEILLEIPIGLEGVDREELEGALARPQHQILYNNVDDIFEIAAWYAVAISKAHAFSDGNKRTALVVMLAYLDMQGVEIQNNIRLDDTMVEVVESKDDHEIIVLALASYLRSVAIF